MDFFSFAIADSLVKAHANLSLAERNGRPYHPMVYKNAAGTALQECLGGAAISIMKDKSYYAVASEGALVEFLTGYGNLWMQLYGRQQGLKPGRLIPLARPSHAGQESVTPERFAMLCDPKERRSVTVVMSTSLPTFAVKTVCSSYSDMASIEKVFLVGPEGGWLPPLASPGGWDCHTLHALLGVERAAGTKPWRDNPSVGSGGAGGASLGDSVTLAAQERVAAFDKKKLALLQALRLIVWFDTYSEEDAQQLQFLLYVIAWAKCSESDPSSVSAVRLLRCVDCFRSHLPGVNNCLSCIIPAGTTFGCNHNP